MNVKFPNKLNPKLAEFIGILLGDGSIGIYKCKAGDKIKIQHKLQVTCNSVDDREYIDYLENLVKELFGIKPRKSFRDKKTCDLRILHRDIIKFFLNEVGLKISPKWKRAKIPKTYMNTPLELDILRGYFDTDGCVVLTNNNGIMYNRLEMKICPSPMKKQFLDILRRYDFNFGVYDIGNGEVRVQMNGRKEIKKWLKIVGFSNQKHINKII